MPRTGEVEYQGDQIVSRFDVESGVRHPLEGEAIEAGEEHG